MARVGKDTDVYQDFHRACIDPGLPASTSTLSRTEASAFRNRAFKPFIIAVLASLLIVPSTASACSNESSPGFRSYLPDCRAYELVTPPYKQGAKIAFQEASEGGALRIESFGNFSEPENIVPNMSGFGDSYLLSRGSAGWTASSLAPPSTFSIFTVKAMSPDFGRSLWLAAPARQFVTNVYLGSPTAPLTLAGLGGPLTEPNGPSAVALSNLLFAGASDDFHHILLRDESRSRPEEETRLWPGDTTHGGGLPSLYEYEGTGSSESRNEPRLVGVSNEESVEDAARKEGKQHINEAAKLISNCGTVIGSAREGDTYNPISASGATVFFTAEACGVPLVSEVYARLDGERTVAISEPSLSVPGRECTGVCETAEIEEKDRQPGLFAGASLDGSKVFFLTGQSLVNGDEGGDGSGMDLYEEGISEGAVTRLAQVSRGGLGDATPGSGAGVLGVARVSEDGSHVYYVAEGVLTGANREGKAPVAGKPNLYVSVTECPGGEASCADSQHTAFIATLSRERDGADWNSTDVRPVQATPDGHFLVFESTEDLTPDDTSELFSQVFEYDAQAETLVRISQGEDGYNEDGNTSQYPAVILSQAYERESRPDERFTNLAVSGDGSHVFFTSKDALTRQALEGFTNVYEYHEGQVSLITDGHDTHLSHEFPSGPELIGTDESGQDVFFTTADSLGPQDSDTHVDIYDARDGGGFLAPEEPAVCSGNTCQGAAGAPPSLLSPLTAAVTPEAAIAPVPIQVRTRPPTRAEQLAKALKKCRSKHNKHRRTACESQARHRFASAASKSNRGGR
jgi:hypothetical protein